MSSSNGWDESAGAWIADMDRGDVSRVHLLDSVMLALCDIRPDIRALDVGCGEGRFCRILKERGADVTGIDPTQELIEEARRRGGAGEYHRAFAEDLPFSENSFDLAVSYLTLIDIEDFRAAIAEMVRVLRPGGTLLIANLTAMATATPYLWWRGENGEKLFWTVDNYMTERAEWTAWRGIKIRNWHRPLSAYMKEFLRHGMILECYDEPMPTAEQLSRAPALNENIRKPDFVVMRWRKPSP